MNLVSVLYNRSRGTFHLEGCSEVFATAQEAILAWEDLNCEVAWLGGSRLVGNSESRVVVQAGDCWITVDPMDGCWVAAFWGFEPTTEALDEAMMFILDQTLVGAIEKASTNIQKMSKLV